MADQNVKSRAGTNAKPQDEDIMRGHTLPAGGLTEDQKRAMGIDVAQDAEPHDYSPSANRGTGGDLFDTYGPGMKVEHPNVTGPTAELVLGQAPVVPAWPMRGSEATNEQVDMYRPNAINQSPVVRGVDKDPRNDPTHPEFDKADKGHPDYGKPIAQQRGIRTEAPTFEELAADIPESQIAKDAKAADAAGKKADADKAKAQDDAKKA